MMHTTSRNVRSLTLRPQGQIVVLGPITTKTGRVETVDELLRRIEEAGRYISLDQLALSPQCGFASETGV